MTERISHFWRYWEGTNFVAAIVVPAVTCVALWHTRLSVHS